jgi:GTP-binding protein
MEISSAEFVISNTDVTKCPEGHLPEFAFIGRSNVGKSSLINMLTGKKNLAMTSQKPGKTQLINHFFINKQWYLVDLPGYGYAQRGKEGRENIGRIIESYITKERTADQSFRSDRLPSRTARHRSLFHGMARQQRRSLFHHLYQDGQTGKEQTDR